MAEEKYVIFELNEQKYCMRLMRINGIEQDYRIIPIPVGPNNIKGIINLRDEVIPVYSLKSKFKMSDDNDSIERKLLVSQIKDVKLGFEVDNVIAIEAVDEQRICGMPPVVKSNDTLYIENIINVNDEIIICISVDNIMSENDYLELAKVIEDNQ